MTSSLSATNIIRRSRPRSPSDRWRDRRRNDDSKARLRAIPALFAQDRSQDRQKKEPGDLQEPRGRRGSRTRGAVFQAALKAGQRGLWPRSGLTFAILKAPFISCVVGHAQPVGQKKPAGGVWRVRGSRCWNRSEGTGPTRENRASTGRQDLRELRRCCAPRLLARRVPRGRAPARSTRLA